MINPIQAYEQLAVSPAPVAYGRRDVKDGGEHGKDHRPPQPFLSAVPDEPPADQYSGQQQPDDGQANLARADPAVLDDFRAPDCLVGIHAFQIIKKIIGYVGDRMQAKTPHHHNRENPPGPIPEIPGRQRPPKPYGDEIHDEERRTQRLPPRLDELTGSQRGRIRTFRSQRTAQLAFHEPSIKRSDAPRPRRIVVPHRRGCTPGTPEVQSGSETAPSSGKRGTRPADGTGPRNKENPMSP
mgnify:CR=1 FL=1